MVFIISKGVSKSFIIDEVHASPATLWSTITDIESMPQFISTLKDVKIRSRSDNKQVEGGDQSSCSSRTNSSSKISSNQINSRHNDNININNNLMIEEGCAWEETRFMIGRESKLAKCVTCIGSNCSSVVNHTNGINHDSNHNSMIQHQQKFIRINATVLGKSQKKHRHGSKTCTMFVDWDEIMTADANDTVNISATSKVIIGTKNSEIVVLPTKQCQFTVTMAYIPTNFFLRCKLILGSCLGINRRIDRTIQNEMNDIITEAERREQAITVNHFQ
jgi:Polyketide cyclase / dehydrase and lipid transport